MANATNSTARWETHIEYALRAFMRVDLNAPTPKRAKGRTEGNAIAP
jgi:hypothetical protein